MNASQSSPRIGLAMLLCAVAGAATVATLALAARAPHPVAASSGGKIGFSGNPAQGGQTCNRCHSGGTAPEVRITGPARVMPGDTVAYTLTIAGGQRVAGGLDVSTTGGFLHGLLGNMDVQESEGEITQLRPKPVDDAGEVHFHFAWFAPETAGRFKLYGAGNSTDGSGNPRGDAAATAVFEIVVGDAPSETETPTPGQASPTPDGTTTPPTVVPTTPPVPTPTPGDFETVFSDLNNPHGLSTLAIATFLVAEGGTGDPDPGEFAPGNGDGRVQELGPTSADRRTVVTGLTNAQDPGGGVVGANHALRMYVSGSGSSPESVVLVAQAGGPGHLRPDEAARILKVASDGTVTTLADTLAFERANNPGGETGPDALDSNPWRLRQFGPRVLVVDSGANDVLAMDPATGSLSVWAVFAPIGASQPIPTGIAIQRDTVYVALLGPMFSEDPVAQIRRLSDENGDGDALDEGENTLFIDGLRSPTDLALGPFGHVYVLEMLPGTLSRIDPSCWSATAACPASARQVLASGLTAATAMTWDDNFDAMVTVGPAVAPGAVALRTDRVVRVPVSVLNPTATPVVTTLPPTTPPTPVATTPTPATPTPTPHVTEAPTGTPVYLPTVLLGGVWD